MSRIARFARPLRLALLPLLAVAAVAVFLLMRPRAASELAADASTTDATAATIEATSVPAAAAANTVAEVSPEVLAQALATWRDPFQAEAAELVSMQEKIKLKEKEIQVLRLTLEEKKLREQLRGPDRDSLRTRASSAPAAAATTERVTVKALLCSEARRAALLMAGSTSAWVCEGESFGGMQVVRLDSETATFMTADGRRVVIAMQR